MSGNYLHPASNRQIGQILRYGKPAEYYSLMELISKFARISAKSRSRNDYRRIVHMLIINYKDDTTFYRDLWNGTAISDTYNSEDYSYVSRFYGDMILERFPNMHDSIYLDVGCGTGVKTKAIAKKLGIHPDHIHGTDIEGWHNWNKKSMNYKQIAANGAFQYEDNTFTFITSFMTLHHISDVENTISEIARCLKPGGIFLIREHNASNDISKMLCDIEHLAYDTKENRSHTLTDPKNTMYYRSRCEWTKLMKEYNLEYVTGDYDYSATETISPTKPFHAFYRLI